MPDYIELAEDEDWAGVLAGDGWSHLDREPINLEVEAHISRCFGDAQTVMCETLSKFVHLDIHVIPPSYDRGFTTYVTSGMSDRPTTAPAGYSNWERAELIVALPGAPEDHIDGQGRHHYLIDHLRNYARRPHAMGLCFILGDTIGAMEPDETIGPDTRMAAHLLARPVLTPVVDAMDAFRMTASTGEIVNFLALEPIHDDELSLKLKEGSHVLIERLEDAGQFELYDPNRASVVAPPKAKAFSLKRMFGG